VRVSDTVLCLLTVLCVLCCLLIVVHLFSLLRLSPTVNTRFLSCLLYLRSFLTIPHIPGSVFASMSPSSSLSLFPRIYFTLYSPHPNPLPRLISPPTVAATGMWTQPQQLHERPPARRNQVMEFSFVIPRHRARLGDHAGAFLAARIPHPWHWWVPARAKSVAPSLRSPAASHVPGVLFFAAQDTRCVPAECGMTFTSVSCVSCMIHPASHPSSSAVCGIYVRHI